MKTKALVSSAVAAMVAVTPVSQAMADADGLVGGIVGGIIGGAIINEANKNRTNTRTVYRSTGVSSATRAANRETQTALNYFGFNAGGVDGVIGRGTRAAIAQYQAHLGYPATGNLTPYERDFLVTSYQRALAGGAATAQMIAQNPMGVRGLLTTFRDQALGVQPQQPGLSASVVPQVTVPTTVVVPAAPAPAPVTTAAAAEPAAPAKPALPSFLGGSGGAAEASLASHCNKVNLLTSTNGGFVTAATMTDPMVALNEQFCLARTYAIAEGEELVAKVQGFTPQQIAEQCAGFGPAMKEQVTALSVQPLSAVVQSTSNFVLKTGMSPAELAGTAKICLSVGYRTDDLDTAVASALLLASLGEGAYGELLGHHLSQGFGASKRPDLALAWYDMGLDAVAQGQRQVVAPGQPERSDLLRKAAYSVAGKSDEASAGASVLPVFKVD